MFNKQIPEFKFDGLNFMYGSDIFLLSDQTYQTYKG